MQHKLQMPNSYPYKSRRFDPLQRIPNFPLLNHNGKANLQMNPYQRHLLGLADLQGMSEEYGINIIIGTIAYGKGQHFNRAYFLSPGKSMQWYGKRALYGWDEDNFSAGDETGIFEIAGFRIGVRICYEIRFP